MISLFQRFIAYIMGPECAYPEHAIASVNAVAEEEEAYYLPCHAEMWSHATGKVEARQRCPSGGCMNTHEILVAARALIDTPDRWCKNVIGYTTDGAVIYDARQLDGGMVGNRYCAFGAIRAITRDGEVALLPSKVLSEVATGTDTFDMQAINWHNAPERTHREVMAAFDLAIEATANERL